MQDALDEVEYVTGDASTKWGAQRAKDGHPAPFPLHYIEIGNEDWLDNSGSYKERLPQFALALRKKYPQYKLIATAPLKNGNAGTEPDVVDDHYYKSPAEMFDLVHRYDDCATQWAKDFCGRVGDAVGLSYAELRRCAGRCGVDDVAWSATADLIVMSAYAPMLVNVNPGAMQWATDLIGFDAQTTYGSPSYYAQALFAGHVGERNGEDCAERKCG